MRYVLLCLCLIGCAPLEKARTPQQKNLTPKAFETITEAVDEPEIIFYEDDFPDDEVEPKVGPKFHKKISFSATEETNIRQILTQMAALAGVNVFVSNDVQGAISFNAKDRPFINILQDICETLELKYTIKNDSVKIEIDSPAIKVYNVQFLNIQRDMQSSVSVSTDIFSESKTITGNGSGSDSNGGMAASAGGKNNGSSSLVTGLTKNDFWQELENALKTIVGTGEQNYVSVHRQGGIITVYAPQMKQKAVQKYLKLLKETTESQVLIEAKILEVNLNDEFRSGINWNILRGGAFASREFGKEEADYFSFGVNKSNLNIVARLIERFGAVKTLSSPRITVLNNQSAVLKVAQNEVIYMPSLQRQYATTADNRSTDFLSTNLHTIPIGLIMSVVPSIDRKTNSILLNLRPTISRIVRYKDVPFIYQMSVAGNKSTNANSIHKIPVVDIREFDSVLRLQSGQVVVMGGLMQEKSSNNRAGLPGFPQTDVAFGGREKSTEITELVIFLKATIIRRKNKAHHNADKKFYKTYANDPRPLEFKK